MQGRIASITISPFQSQIVVPFKISRENKIDARIVIVQIADAEQHIGIGEAAPFTSLTFDTIETAEPLMRDLSAGWVGLTAEDALKRLYVNFPEARRTSVTAPVGLEMALLDLIAQLKGEPLYRRFGDGRCRTHHTDITLPILTKPEIANFWQAFSGFGFEHIKIKASGNIGADVAMIEEFFRLVEKPVAFSLDGNQGFTPDDALRLITQLARLGRLPEFFEQPLPEADWGGLARLTLESTVPICLDESVRTLHDVHRAHELKAGRMINLKIMKSGIAETMSMAREASRLGVRLMIGGMLESEIAMTMSLHMVAGMNCIEHLDLDTPYFYAENPTQTHAWDKRRATLDVTDAPGLGLTLIRR